MFEPVVTAIALVDVALLMFPVVILLKVIPAVEGILVIEMFEPVVTAIAPVSVELVIDAVTALLMLILVAIKFDIVTLLLLDPERSKHNSEPALQFVNVT